jgi:hypothetical protein
VSLAKRALLAVRPTRMDARSGLGLHIRLRNSLRRKLYICTKSAIRNGLGPQAEGKSLLTFACMLRSMDKVERISRRAMQELYGS